MRPARLTRYIQQQIHGRLNVRLTREPLSTPSPQPSRNLLLWCLTTGKTPCATCGWRSRFAPTMHRGLGVLLPKSDDSTVWTAPPSLNPSTRPARRACDCCRKRKVKCDGGEPCAPCQRIKIRCAYLQEPKKKGPKGLRSARVLDALREIDEHFAGPATTGEPEFNTGEGYQARQIIPFPLTKHPDDGVPLVDSGATPTTSAFNNNFDANGRVSSLRFLPYVQLFFQHMFPIMPVIDGAVYLDPLLYAAGTTLSTEVYCFLCTLCAATSAQLDASIAQPPPICPGSPNDVLLASAAVRERRLCDPTGPATTLSVMTSFFLFAYYGNHEQHEAAWYYLQESITFCEILDMDNEESYTQMEPVEAQWKRRLYWLLFITERAYAVQRRKRTRLVASIGLPSALESENSQMLNGFVDLAVLFSAIDENFVTAWRGSRLAILCNGSHDSWLVKTQAQLDAAVLRFCHTTETQRLDIEVTREWLHVLAWQLGVSNGLVGHRPERGMQLQYPIELAREVVRAIQGASLQALSSHGIGMEQKLSDISGCLIDVLKCTSGDTTPAFLEGRRYLNLFLLQLSSIRGRQSRYLQPLIDKMEGLIGYELNAFVQPASAPQIAEEVEETSGAV